MKEINFQGSQVTIYGLCVIAAALEQGEEVTIRNVEASKHPRTSTQWLAEIEKNPHRRLNGDT